MKPFLIRIVCLVVVSFAFSSHAAEFKWSGMRLPCKVSVSTTNDLGQMIGQFVTLANKDEYAHAIFNVNNKFPNSTPWATWGVGPLQDYSNPLTDAQHNEYLSYMDVLGVDIYLELRPGNKNNVLSDIDTWLGKLKSHQCVKGMGVDLEFCGGVNDATAQSWNDKIKTHKSSYRLFLKHWETGMMPATYRGTNNDLIFICTSSESTISSLNSAFASWATKFSPNACAYHIGYPADEDGMNGSAGTGWCKLSDPIKDWGTSLQTALGNKTQDFGILWVCVKSGKSYNTSWNLTSGATLPGTSIQPLLINQSNKSSANSFRIDLNLNPHTWVNTAKQIPLYTINCKGQVLATSNNQKSAGMYIVKYSLPHDMSGDERLAPK